jgi:RNA polymerase sigma-70 factor (ECF subfamily)
VTGNPPSDAELLTALRADADLIGELYDRYAVAVHRFLVRRVGTTAAEDLVSEVFVAALAARKRFFPHPSGSALPWLYGIATNTVRVHVRRLRPFGSALPDSGMDWDAVDARLDAEAKRVHLRAVLTALSAKERDVLLLVAWEGLTVTEAADALGMTKVAARARLHRARQRAQVVLANLDSPTSSVIRDLHPQGELR